MKCWTGGYASLGHVVQVGLMNVDGYFDTLLAFFDKALDEGFLNLASRQIVVSASTASDLLTKMEVLWIFPRTSNPEICSDCIGSYRNV